MFPLGKEYEFFYSDKTISEFSHGLFSNCLCFLLFQVNLFVLLSVVCVLLNLAGFILGCQGAQFVSSVPRCDLVSSSESSLCTWADPGLLATPRTRQHLKVKPEVGKRKQENKTKSFLLSILLRLSIFFFPKQGPARRNHMHH